MTNKEIETHRQKLADILADDKESTENRREKLEKLAQKVGASITRTGQILTKSDVYGKQHYNEENVITETEIVYNIQVALQTATMINMGKTGSRNFWIALIATIAAVISAVAAWAAVMSKQG